MKKCNNCQNLMLDDVEYCYYCGKKVKNNRKTTRQNRKGILIAVCSVLCLSLVVLIGYEIFILFDHFSNRGIPEHPYNPKQNTAINSNNKDADNIIHDSAIVLNDKSITGADFSCTLDEFISNYNMLVRADKQSEYGPELGNDIAKMDAIEHSDFIFTGSDDAGYDVYEYDYPYLGTGTKLIVSIVLYINPNSSQINKVCYCFDNKVLSYGTETYKNNVINTRVKNVFSAIGLEHPIQNYVNKALDDQNHVFYKNGIVFYIQSQSNEDVGTFTMYCAEAEAEDYYQAILTGKESPYPKVLQNKEIEEKVETSNNAEFVFTDDEASQSDIGLQFPQPYYGETLQNSDGHTIYVKGFDGTTNTYSIEISIIRAINLSCEATISGDKMYFYSKSTISDDKIYYNSNEGFAGYIQYNGQDYTLIFEKSRYPLETEKVFYGFYNQPELVSADSSFYIGTWTPEYDGLTLSIDDFDGQFIQGSVSTYVGTIPFSGYYDSNSGLFASYSYGEYLVDLALYQNEYNGEISYLGIEYSIRDQEWNSIFGTTGGTKLYKSHS